MAQIDNIDPIKSFFSSEKLQIKIFNFLKKNNYKIINKKEYLDKSFDQNLIFKTKNASIKINKPYWII